MQRLSSLMLGFTVLFTACSTPDPVAAVEVRGKLVGADVGEIQQMRFAWKPGALTGERFWSVFDRSGSSVHRPEFSSLSMNSAHEFTMTIPAQTPLVVYFEAPGPRYATREILRDDARFTRGLVIEVPEINVWGTVRDSNGTLIRNACIVLGPVGYHESLNVDTLRSKGITESDSAGQFQFGSDSDLPVIVAVSDNGSIGWASRRDDPPYEILVRQRATLSVDVSTPTPIRKQNIHVKLESKTVAGESALVGTFFPTNSEQFSIPDLPASPLGLEVRIVKPIQGALGPEAYEYVIREHVQLNEGVNSVLSLTLPEMVQIRGRLRVDGLPAISSKLTILAEPGGPEFESRVQVSTNDQGAFLVSSLPKVERYRVMSLLEFEDGFIVLDSDVEPIGTDSEEINIGMDSNIFSRVSVQVVGHFNREVSLFLFREGGDVSSAAVDHVLTPRKPGSIALPHQTDEFLALYLQPEVNYTIVGFAAPIEYDLPPNRWGKRIVRVSPNSASGDYVLDFGFND